MKDTAQNIKADGKFVVNMVTENLFEAMNVSATDFPPKMSELAIAVLHFAPSIHINVPRVAEAHALCVRRVEAMDLVAAAWWSGETGCIIATLHGGRQIAVMPTADGRWAACNAFLDELFATPQEAARKLNMLLKRGRTGYVGHVRISCRSTR